MQDVFFRLKKALKAKMTEHDLADQRIDVCYAPLSPEEAIGNPRHRDYPLQQGRERMIEARIGEARGQAFTDRFAEGTTTVGNLLKLDLALAENRAIFISSLNAVWALLGLCKGTIHCRNEEPVECGKKLSPEMLDGEKILQIGLQPRLAEALARPGLLRIIDLDRANHGKKIKGCTVEGLEQTQEAINWCDSLFITGTVVVNGTIDRFLDTGKPVTFYGVTIAAPAAILGLNRYCMMQERDQE